MSIRRAVHSAIAVDIGKGKSGSEQESVELPNWRALGVAAAPATDPAPSARPVARGQTVDKANIRSSQRRIDGSFVMRGVESLTDIHHGISRLATMRALASMS